MKKILLVSILFFYGFLQAQINKPLIQKGNGVNTIQYNDSISRQDSLHKKIKIFPVTDYKIFNLKQDTIHADTLLSIRKYYAFNELLEDDFLQLKLHNYGQAVNALAFELHKNDVLPGFVASSKRTDFWTHEQVPFFQTPSPYSDMTFLNGVSQGQMLNALFTTNVNPQVNIAAGYRGLSSLGLYKRSIVSSNRFFGSIV